MSAPVIQAVRGVPYRLPLTSPLAWGAHSALQVAEHVLVQVELSNGTLGQAEATPRPTIYGETVASVLGILAHLAPALEGLSIEDTAALGKVLRSVANNHTARGALDMALWDARAQANGQRLFELLRGPRERIPVSFILGIAPLQDMLHEAERVFEAGVRCLKVKVGRDYQQDLAVIRALREQFGPELSLYADSNETLSPDQAPAVLDAMREAGLMYVEEPLPVRQLKARAALHQRQLLPIVADDSCFTLADLERELAFDTFDILNVKTARNGFTEGLEMLKLAQATGKRGMVGSQASSGLGTLHAALLASQETVQEPCELSFVLKLQDDLLNAPITFKDGYLQLTDLGDHALDPEKVRKYRL